MNKTHFFYFLPILLLLVLLFTGCPPADTDPPVPTPSPISEDDFEPDNTYTAATEILYESDTTGTYDQQHTIYPVGDQDWFHFSAEAGEVYVIELYPVDNGTDADTLVTIYASDTVTCEGFDHDSGVGLYSKIVFSCTSTEIYYLKVYVEQEQTGEYMISVMHLVENGIIEIGIY